VGRSLELGKHWQMEKNKNKKKALFSGNSHWETQEKKCNFSLAE